MPCMRCCRACCVFSPKLGIIIQDFARQLFDQLLADQAILMAGGDASTTHTGSTVPRFYSSDDPPWCRVRATHRETVLPSDLLSPCSLRLARKAAADNQSLRLHRPQATVSPTAVSYSFLIRSLRPNRTTDRRAERLRKPRISLMKRWHDRPRHTLHSSEARSGDPSLARVGRVQRFKDTVAQARFTGETKKAALN